MVEILLPWQGGCPYRERALRFVLDRYHRLHPDWIVTVAEAPPGPWVKALAVNPAVERSSADIIVVADADVLTDLLPAVHQVEEGAPWAIPHRMVHRLSEKGTRAVLGGEPWEGQPVDESYQGVEGGGVVVASRDVLLACPFDARYIGWGQEDHSAAMALYCLYGPPWRGDADLWHLWHPPQPRMTRRRGNPEGWRLYKRYLRAQDDSPATRALIEEGRHADRATHQSALHPDPQGLVGR